MTKEERIKGDYGKDYEILMPDENGLSTKIIMYQDFDFEKYDSIDIGHGVYLARPKSLRGIETNNGWIKVESEKDLPTEDIMYRTGFFKENDEFYQDNNLSNLKTTLRALTDHYYTHYQPAPKSDSPLF